MYTAKALLCTAAVPLISIIYPGQARDPGLVPPAGASHVHRLAARGFQRRYRVRPGDTLSSIARKMYGKSGDWPALWWVNREHVTNPNAITVGRRLWLSRWHPQRHWLDRAAQRAIPRPAPAHHLAASHQPAAAAVSTAPQGSIKGYAESLVGPSQFSCLDILWTRESGWNTYAANPTTGAYGIPQALPGGKMAAAGADWASDPYTQIRWGVQDYIDPVYGSACGALAHSNATGWY